MLTADETLRRLTDTPSLLVSQNTPLATYTRFGIGGPARILVQSDNEQAFVAGLSLARESELPWVVIGSGANLVVSDDGFAGVVLHYTANIVRIEGSHAFADAGAELQNLVDASVDSGLAGLETMTGIPGSVGAAVYGNAGAYGHSISEYIQQVRFFDGTATRAFTALDCQFQYRESIFKRTKGWIILSTELVLEPGDASALRQTADEIHAVRDRKFPPTMKCAGSIFKNLYFRDLPASAARLVPEEIVKGGKVPAGFFLEQVGSKGMSSGGIHVADYHANLIYNAGGGTASELRALITALKVSVSDRFSIVLEEEVQYVGFDASR